MNSGKNPLPYFVAAVLLAAPMGLQAQEEPRPTKAPPAEREPGHLKNEAPAPKKKKKKAEPLSPEKAQELFQTLFADSVADAKRSSNKEDDLQLAGQMLETAKSSMEHPNLVALMARGAYDLTAGLSDGYPTAVDAAQMLRRVAPESQQREAAGLGLTVLKKWYRGSLGDDRQLLGKRYIEQLMSMADLDREAEDMASALRRYREARMVASRIRYEGRDQIEDARKEVILLKKTYDRIDLYKTRLKRNKQDQAAVEALVKLYVVVLNQPRQARKYTFLLKDRDEAKNISRAALPIEKLSAEDAYALGNWYEGLSKENPKLIHLLENTIGAYERFLDASSDQKGIRVTAAKLKLKGLKERYDKATEPKIASLPRGRVVDLVKYIHLKRHTVRGKWVKSGSRIGSTNPGGNSLIRIPIQPEGDYQFQVTIERKGLTGGPITVVLPVQGRMVNFVIGDGYADYYYSYLYGGLSQVRGYGVTTSANPTRSGGAFLNNKRHNFIISVLKRGEDQVRIHATYNGKKYFDWTGPLEQLSPDDRWKLEGPATFGLGTYKATVAFHVVRFKLIKGVAKVLKSSDLVTAGGGS
ncbi:MAG: hypothetical protein R3236_09740 [Phycisphaeraceae bacterium]|nr:hypothetical protein [Phycisphaeraceae bacterium]